MIELSAGQVTKMVAEVEQKTGELGDRVQRLWTRVCIQPERWKQDQYPDAGEFWVVAIMGRCCLYFNPAEGGWGWGRFRKYGTISDYHWQQDEIQHSIYQAMYGIDYGGSG